MPSYTAFVASTTDDSKLPFESRRSCAYGTRGMVSCSQPLAAQAGLRILQAGGTAADAAVAMAAALAVTEPCHTGACAALRLLFLSSIHVCCILLVPCVCCAVCLFSERPCLRCSRSPRNRRFEAHAPKSHTLERTTINNPPAKKKLPGLGGDAFALFYDSEAGAVRCLAGNGAAPQGLTLDAIRAAGVEGHELPLFSALTVTVPGAAALWEDAVRMFGGGGGLSLADVLAPAVELAEEGWAVGPTTAWVWGR